MKLKMLGEKNILHITGDNMELTRVIPHICNEWLPTEKELELFHEIERLNNELRR